LIKQAVKTMVMTEELQTIQDRIINAVPVEKLYLFGSYANGTPNENSDYDFYVVLPNDGLRPVEAVQNIFHSVRGMNRKPMDILAGTIDTFERRSKQITLERTIATEGVLLYEKP
jgi:predicted nucleotidyltransferase